MVEPQIVVLVVAGSSPVGHPPNFRFSTAILDLESEDGQSLCSIGNLKSQISNLTVPVAQPDRASDFGSEGWGFESLQARHFSAICRLSVALIRLSVSSKHFT
jgi:hypothetical protein